MQSWTSFGQSRPPLIIPRRHISDFFLTTGEEKAAMLSLLDKAKLFLDGKYTPDGYNVGINVGEVAGQTVMHVHMHLIPRYQGDLETRAAACAA